MDSFVLEEGNAFELFFWKHQKFYEAGEIN
jgi:hypothetical protein